MQKVKRILFLFEVIYMSEINIYMYAVQAVRNSYLKKLNKCQETMNNKFTNIYTYVKLEWKLGAKIICFQRLQITFQGYLQRKESPAGQRKGSN